MGKELGAAAYLFKTVSVELTVLIVWIALMLHNSSLENVSLVISSMPLVLLTIQIWHLTPMQ